MVLSLAPLKNATDLNCEGGCDADSPSSKSRSQVKYSKSDLDA